MDVHDVQLPLGDHSNPNFSEALQIADNLITECKSEASMGALGQSIMLLQQICLGPASAAIITLARRHLVIALLTRFINCQRIRDLEEGIGLMVELLKALPEKEEPTDTCVSDPTERQILVESARSLGKEYYQSINRSKVREAIQLYKNLLQPDLAVDEQPVIAYALSLAQLLLIDFRPPRTAEEDLERVISRLQVAKGLLPPRDPLRFCCMTLLSVVHWIQLIRGNDPEAWKKVAMEYLEAGKEDEEAMNAFTTGTNIRRAFLRGDIDRNRDLGQAISLLSQSLSLRPQPHLHRPSSLRNLATALCDRFEQQQGDSLADIDQSIALFREVLRLRSRHHPDRPESLDNLADTLETRYRYNIDLVDLNEAIALRREALNSRPLGHPGRATSLDNLASALRFRFAQMGDLENLGEAILLHQESLELMPMPHPNRSVALNNLANALQDRYEHEGNVADLENAIACNQEALDLRPPPHPNRTSSLTNLASGLRIRFEKAGARADLDKAITLYQEALPLLPDRHPNRLVVLNNLAGALGVRFNQIGKLTDLDEAITMYRMIFDLWPAAHPDQVKVKNNFAHLLHSRFKRTGKAEDLDEAIALHQDVLTLIPASHPKRFAFLNNLANATFTRFEQKGIFADIDSAIAFHREALTLVPASHPDRSQSLNNLAGTLHIRFQEKGDLQDLLEAIPLLREAVRLRPEPHPERASSLGNLASALHDRFDRTGDIGDIDEAIAFHRESVRLRPTPHPDRSHSLNNLAVAAYIRFEKKGEISDLDDAIEFHRQALALRLPPHPNEGQSLGNLASALLSRFEQRSSVSDLDEAFLCFRGSAASATSPLFFRLQYCRMWAFSAQRHNHHSALAAYQCAIDLLPFLASLDLGINERQAALSNIKNLASDAARCAIEAKDFQAAVVLLSAGRAIFWSQALQLRSPFDDLESVLPDLAFSLRNTARKLEQGSHRGIQQPSNIAILPAETSLKQDGSSYYRGLVDEWRSTIEQVRKNVGFENFLRPKSFAELCKCASRGPVVVLNASRRGCDALIIADDSVRHVPLSLKYDAAMSFGKYFQLFIAGDGYGSPIDRAGFDGVMQELSSERIDRLKGVRRPDPGRSVDDHLRILLDTLWTSIVRPVVSALELVKTDSLRRIWWCPTGPFMFLPIHAAGTTSSNGIRESLSDYAISSYCTTLQDLLVPSMPRSAMPSEFKLLAVIQPEAAGASSLPNVQTEFNKIISHLPQPHDDYLVARFGTSDASTTVDQVLTDLPSISVAHFGCHGRQNLRNPLESCLLLSGGELKMSSIIQCQISNASLAYLSACETAKNDEERPDEAMHLSATMMFAGFRGVVGTMWSIYDDDAPIVADVFYGHLFRGGTKMPPDPTEAAYALHLAVKELQRQGKEIRRWIPFVHFGI